MNKNKNIRFIVVTGGVISGVGKGVSTASIGKILQQRGYNITLIKIDPYINYDAGTLRPTEHGEVWVTADGGEIDQDLGTYERVLDIDIPKKNNITTGQVYSAVIERERRGQYLGQTVQFVPHIVDEIVNRIMDAAQDHEFVVIEIGGTVGDYENIPFLFALKSLEQRVGKNNITHMLVTYLPVPHHIHEMKTKPTQQSIRLLGEQGIVPDFIICRSKQPLDAVRKKKIEIFSHIKSDNIIASPDVESVYEMPLVFERQALGDKLLEHFGIATSTVPIWRSWNTRVSLISKAAKSVTVAIVGKYTENGQYSLEDSYLSIGHALIHAGIEAGVRIDIKWLSAHDIQEGADIKKELEGVAGVIVPGGFGTTGVEGKVRIISYVRENNIPYLGICYGLQLAVVEYARNVCNLEKAHTTEVDLDTPFPVVAILPSQKDALEKVRYGGTMRLGAYFADTIDKNSRVYNLYTKYRGAVVAERHRHRYEVNPEYISKLEQNGISFSGYYTRSDGTQLVEFLEIADHPFFIASQGHPEFTSRFGSPNPLFCGFVNACMQQ